MTDATNQSRYTQKEVLNNRQNKSEFISLLSSKMLENGIVSIQREGDADHLIASTTLDVSSTSYDLAILVGTDTDLLVLLVDTCHNPNVFMRFDHCDTYRISSIQHKLGENYKFTC